MVHTCHYMTSVITVQAHGAPLGFVDEVTVRKPERADAEAVLAMLRRCSRTSLYHRFHGFGDGGAYFAELLRNRPTDHTMLAWHDRACVGAATLAAGAARIPDLGVLVEDAWQRRGIGTRLTALLVDRARSTGVTSVHADILNEDLFILRALRRLGPLTTTFERGMVAIDIDLADRLSRSDGTSFPFGFVGDMVDTVLLYPGSGSPRPGSPALGRGSAATRAPEEVHAQRPLSESQAKPKTGRSGLTASVTERKRDMSPKPNVVLALGPMGRAGVRSSNGSRANRLDAETKTAGELYEAMLALYTHSCEPGFALGRREEGQGVRTT